MTKPAAAARSSSSRTSRRSRAKKVSLTVDENVLSAMERAARKAKRTLSAEITDALARELRRRQLQALIAGYESEKGAIGAEELAAIQAEWLA